MVVFPKELAIIAVASNAKYLFIKNNSFLNISTTKVFAFEK